MAAKIAIITVNLFIPGAHSLKDKRRTLHHIKDTLGHRFNASIAETGFLDKWQRAQLTLALVSGDTSYLDSTIQAVKRKIDALCTEVEVESLTVEYC
jgi:uncharacterized protein YlxP (DUF503 family)